MSRIAILMGLLVANAGCASAELLWVKPGATDQELAQDRYACMLADPYKTVFGPGTGSARVVPSKMFQYCMEARGWRLQE